LPGHGSALLGASADAASTHAGAAETNSTDVEAQLDAVAVMGGESTTQGGSPPIDYPGIVLETMGRRGGWTLDELIEKTGLSAHLVGAGVVNLEMSRRIRCDGWYYEPVQRSR